MATINLRIKDTSREYFFFGDDILTYPDWTAVETLDLSDPIKGNLLTALDHEIIEADIPLSEVVEILFPVSPGGSGGEINTALNVGSGEGSLSLPKTGVILPFRTIKAGANVTITETASEVVIESSSLPTVIEWGDIEGTLANQIDLQESIDEKVDSIITSEPLGSNMVLNIVTISQNDYDSGTKSPTTLYIING